MRFIKKNLVYIVLIVIVLVGGGYAAFHFLKPANAGNNNQTVDAVGQNPGGQGRFGGGNRGNFKPLHGTITSINSSTIIMKADDGSSKKIAVASDTRISKMDNGSRTTLVLSDLKTGDELNVMAQDTTTDQITPQMIIVGTFSPPTGGQGGYRDGGWNGGNRDNYGNEGTSIN